MEELNKKQKIKELRKNIKENLEKFNYLTKKEQENLITLVGIGFIKFIDGEEKE